MAGPSIKAAAAVAEARHGVPAPRGWRPSVAGRLLKTGFEAITNRATVPKVTVELLPGGGSRQVPTPAPLRDGDLEQKNRFTVLPVPDDDDDDDEEEAEGNEE